MKLVNIHIPKTAGTSFRKSLEDHFPNIINDYGHKIDRHINELASEFEVFNNNIVLDNYNGLNCVSGHILPIKYKKLYDNNWKFITWLREPSQRLCSHYYHLTRNSNSLDFGKYILDNKLSLEDFVFLPKFKNYYQRFFHNFPIDNYFFIGIVENYESDLLKLSNLLNLNFSKYNDNLNDDKLDSLYVLETTLLDEMKKFHNEDYKLYYKFLKNN